MIKLLYTLLLSTLIVSTAYAETQNGIEPLEMKFEQPNVDDFEPVSDIGRCKIIIAPVVDARPNKETLGQKGNKPIFSNEVDSWANIGLASLKNYGYSLISANQLDDSTFIVEPHIYRLYSWPVQGFRIYGVVAMDIKVTAPNGVVHHKKYRGTGSTNNGWNGDGEYVQAMNAAFNILIQRLADDIKPFCGKNSI